MSRATEDYWREALAGQGEITAAPDDSPWSDRAYNALGDVAAFVDRTAGFDPRTARRQGDTARDDIRNALEFIVGPAELEGALRRTIGGRGGAYDYGLLGLTVLPPVLGKAAKKVAPKVKNAYRLLRPGKPQAKAKGGLAVKRRSLRVRK